MRLAARGCDTASRTGTLSQLVESRLDLVARYADIDLLRAHALRQDRSQWLGPILMRLAAALSRDPERHAAARAELDRAEAWLRRWTTDRDGETGHWRPPGPDDVAAAMEARFRLDGPAAAVSEFRRWRPLRFARRATAVFASRVAAEFTPAELRDTLTTCGVPLADQAPFLAYAASGSAPDPAWVNEISGALVAKPPGQPQPWHAGMLNAAIRYGDRQVTAVLARHWAREVPAGQWTFSTANSEGTAVVRCHAAAAVFAGADLTAEELVPAQLRPQKAGQGGEPDPREHDRKQWTEIVEPIAAAAVLAVRAATGAAGAADVGTFIDQGLAVRAERAGYRWFTHDPSYRAWAVLAAEAAADAGSPPPVLARLADAAQRLLGYGAPELWLDLAVMLSGRGSHTAIAADLCSRAADGARTGTYPAPDRLDIIARAADTAAAIEPDLGRELFGQAVDVAAGINDDAARLLAVHADLASHASLPVHDRPRVAVRLVRAVEAVAPHVTDPRIIPYTEIAGAAARLHPAAGLAAATRWDDQDRIAMASTLPAALAAAVDAGEVTTWQALALDHLIDDDRDRLGYQLDIADRMRAGGAAGQAAARVALGRAAQRLRLDVAACDQPQLARTLLDAAGKHGLDGQIRAVLDPLCALGEAPGTTRGLPSTRRDGGELQPEMQAMLADPATRGWDRLADDVAALTGASVYGEELRTFIASVVGSAPPGERVDALAAAAALPGEHATTVLSVLADYLRQWRTWPGVTAWAAAELPDLLHRCLPDLAWNQDTGRLLSQLRAFADDRTVRQAILRALPEARPRLTAFGWQNICALLGRLCDSGEAATALLALLDDRLQGDDSEEAAAAGPEGPVPMVLWSAFGHPRRAIRWRAAHAARDLLAHPDPAAAGPLAAALVRCLDHDDPGPFRDPALHFYRLSASTGLLVALQQIAVTDPALLVPHLDELIRHATSRDLPHAQIRELARQAVLAIAAPADPRTETLRSANQPDRCHTYRKPRQAHSDRRISEDRRYRFDQMDTIPYWYAPLARVFDIPVEHRRRIR